MTKRKRVSARSTVERHCNPGNAASYITHDGIQPGDRVVLCCRVSTRQQNHRGNLTAHERHLRAEIAARRAEVVGLVRYVGSGCDPLWVSRAAAIAKPHHAKLVALTTDRFVRHPDYKSTGSDYERNARANTEALEDLKRYVGGVELVTLVDPDAPLATCMGVMRRVGQQVKWNPGGRPKKNPPGYKKQRRLKNQPQVFWMHAVGYTARRIARILDLPESTVRRWVRRFFR